MKLTHGLQDLRRFADHGRGQLLEERRANIGRGENDLLTVHLIAHSMGTRLLAMALESEAFYEMGLADLSLLLGVMIMQAVEHLQAGIGNIVFASATADRSRPDRLRSVPAPLL